MFDFQINGHLRGDLVVDILLEVLCYTVMVGYMVLVLLDCQEMILDSKLCALMPLMV